MLASQPNPLPLNEDVPPKAPSHSHDYAAFRQTFLAKRPGTLTTHGTLTLKTRLAQRYFLGLLPFASQMNAIYQASRLDDPYADFYLMKIENALIKTQECLREQSQLYQQQLSNLAGLQMQLADTDRPLSVPIYFATPYAHFATRLLVELDALARCVISLNKLGLPLEKPLSELLRGLGKSFRSTLGKCNGWQHTGITRQDVVENTPLAIDAKQRMGKLDPRIMNKSLRAKLAPRIISVSKPKNVSKAPTKNTIDPDLPTSAP
jgi:integrating conjugative element protein (TIGR03761 family)